MLSSSASERPRTSSNDYQFAFFDAVPEIGNDIQSLCQNHGYGGMIEFDLESRQLQVSECIVKRVFARMPVSEQREFLGEVGKIIGTDSAIEAQLLSYLPLSSAIHSMGTSL